MTLSINEITDEYIYKRRYHDLIAQLMSLMHAVRTTSTNDNLRNTIMQDLITHFKGDITVRNQMEEVISNLLINADQSMQDGGIIKISAEKLTVADANDTLPLQPGDYVILTITDEGVGISKQHLVKIFDPYYSSKEEGSGLGLTICYSILKKHGGHISVESVDGEGTSITVFLPVSSEKTESHGMEDTISLGYGKILFMDDEESVRETVGEMLTFLGYDVEFTKDGIEVLNIKKHFALTILLMP